ncbi:hypothetical protein [Wolbachia endosymbiont of Pentidionis agamae]|uniref:hypothetical protein n=1 Tax=Wolbachia endosymbiont of Pentidionis agamae TaxID=3110435 RepID=UPI002FD0194E
MPDNTNEIINLHSIPIVSNQDTEKEISNIITSERDLNQMIKKLEGKKLIWDFLMLLNNGHYKEMGKRFDIIKEVNEKIKGSLGEEWLAYKPSDKNLNVRLKSDNPKPIEINKLMALKDYNKFYIHLSEGNEIAVERKNKERHYDFSNTNSPCEMTINWNISRSLLCNNKNYTLILEVDKDGISAIKELKCGKDSIVDKDKILELVKVNKEVFLNGCGLSDSLENYYLKNRDEVVSPELTNPKTVQAFDKNGIEHE